MSKEMDKLYNVIIDAQIKDSDMPDKVMITTMGDLLKAITPARLEIIKTIKEKRPKSVGELARALDRPQEAVSRDLAVLEFNGLIEFERDGRKKKPVASKDAVVIRL